MAAQPHLSPRVQHLLCACLQGKSVYTKTKQEQAYSSSSRDSSGLTCSCGGALGQPGSHVRRCARSIHKQPTQARQAQQQCNARLIQRHAGVVLQGQLSQVGRQQPAPAAPQSICCLRGPVRRGLGRFRARGGMAGVSMTRMQRDLLVRVTSSANSS